MLDGIRRRKALEEQSKREGVYPLAKRLLKSSLYSIMDQCRFSIQ